MKIAYVTLFDATDVQNWSGLYLHIYKALEAQGLEIELIGNLKHGPSLGRRFRKQWGTRVEKRTFLHFWDTDTARDYAADVAARLKNSTADLILSPSPVPLAYLNSPLPKVLWTDATYTALRRDYAEFREGTVSAASAKSALAIDRAVAQNCDLLLYASDWGGEWAIQDAGADPAKVATVPFGANIEVHHSAEDVARMAAARGTEKIRLLFVGVDWERKGAAKAIEVVRALRERGVDAELSLVGCAPPDGVTVPDFVHLLGFISKATEEGRSRIFDLYRDSHFLIVPTFGEAYGLVFAEASAYGMPSLSHRVGGVPTIIRDGVNGQLFELDQPVSAWADWVVSLLNQPGAMERLAVSSFHEYQTRLNWEVAGRDAAGRLQACLAAHKQLLIREVA